MDIKKIKEFTSSKLFLRIVMGISLAVFIGSAIYIIYYFYQDSAMNAQVDDLKTQIFSSDTGDIDITAFEDNEDLVGWIEIEGTSLSYPVVQTPDNEEYYLRRDLDGNYNKNGIPFLSADSSPTGEGGNLVVYGHNMNNDSMFSSLLNYKSSSYYASYPTITYTHVEGTNTYQIIAVCLIDAGEFTAGSTMTPLWPNFIYSTEVEFDEFYENIMSNSLINTGITAEYGDKFITLITCDESIDDGRLVVYGVLIED